MGWMFDWDKNFDKKCLTEKFLRPGFFVQGVSLINHRVVGNSFWAVLQEGEIRMIWLALMQPGGKNEGWGYKSMDESAGPARLDCPLSLLRQCSKPQSEYATKWRSEVESWHKNQAALKRAVVEIKPGMKLVSGDTIYIAVRPAGSRKGWVVQDTAGKLFRMPAAQVSRSAQKHATLKLAKKPEEQICMIF